MRVTSTPLQVLAEKDRRVASVRGFPRGGGSMDASPALSILTAAGEARKSLDRASPRGRVMEKARAGCPMSEVSPTTPGVTVGVGEGVLEGVAVGEGVGVGVAVGLWVAVSVEVVDCKGVA